MVEGIPTLFVYRKVRSNAEASGGSLIRCGSVQLPKIKVMARTQCEVVRLFRETHPDLPPLNQGTISKIEAQYREMGHVRKVPSKRQAVVDDDTKLNWLLALEENRITPARQLARDSNLNHKTVLKNT
ncbi:hypothetical protein NQ318_017625 [Aromia moschata]|uniref:DUF4817 domain-containing protein n=1 Tax=Aromia moschata TaxID=1265417 RepID=A0AAV8Z0D9_9CUCU|nr:hypothetical protein NQ318_017625 [Aromia moschata]